MTAARTRFECLGRLWHRERHTGSWEGCGVEGCRGDRAALDSADALLDVAEAAATVLARRVVRGEGEWYEVPTSAVLRLADALARLEANDGV